VATGLKHRDYTVDRRAGEQCETRGSHVHGALGVIQRIRLVSTTHGERLRELRSVLSSAEFRQNPRPILLGIGAVFAG
jgi:hypothetical protein